MLFAPDRRTTPIPPYPYGVDWATIVSPDNTTILSQPCFFRFAWKDIFVVQWLKH